MREAAAGQVSCTCYWAAAVKVKTDLGLLLVGQELEAVTVCVYNMLEFKEIGQVLT